MNKIAIACIVVILILIWRPAYVKEPVLGRDWHVLKNYDNRAEAAALLSRVNNKAIGVMRYLREKYYVNNEGAVNNNDLHNIVANLIANYNPDVLYENDARGTSETSYTSNKGQAMYICLRRKDDPRLLVNDDELLFVLLHECAHIANYRGWGHGYGFWEIFAFILHEAQEAGLYKPINYNREPVDYCGLKIEYNPLLDPSLKKIWL